MENIKNFIEANSLSKFSFTLMSLGFSFFMIVKVGEKIGEFIYHVSH
ncbi:hypothetical protein [Flammeovirga agarivorans]|uniref:Uncharacterized protein n=1 Tax=Flammeovirga agarivorans TaxID=2726742 RepID=A0A7X8XX39_9BACT|nr:hypothetical protein [Flammeovirga agarivorans]NLR92881.1 hypothetical protein [Flammeovirga agarivorans]